LNLSSPTTAATSTFGTSLPAGHLMPDADLWRISVRCLSGPPELEGHGIVMAGQGAGQSMPIPSNTFQSQILAFQFQLQFQSNSNFIPISYQFHTNFIPISYQFHTNFIPISYQFHTNSNFIPLPIPFLYHFQFFASNSFRYLAYCQ
jgi:hypothetical protein